MGIFVEFKEGIKVSNLTYKLKKFAEIDNNYIIVDIEPIQVYPNDNFLNNDDEKFLSLSQLKLVPKVFSYLNYHNPDLKDILYKNSSLLPSIFNRYVTYYKYFNFKKFIEGKDYKTDLIKFNRKEKQYKWN